MQSPLDTGYISSGFGFVAILLTDRSDSTKGSILQRQSVLKFTLLTMERWSSPVSRGGYGNTVIIEHSKVFDPLRTRREPHGERRRYSWGRTGSRQGWKHWTLNRPHLHFEVIGKDGQHLNPGKFLTKVVA